MKGDTSVPGTDVSKELTSVVCNALDALVELLLLRCSFGLELRAPHARFAGMPVSHGTRCWHFPQP